MIGILAYIFLGDKILLITNLGINPVKFKPRNYIKAFKEFSNESSIYYLGDKMNFEFSNEFLAITRKDKFPYYLELEIILHGDIFMNEGFSLSDLIKYRSEFIETHDNFSIIIPISYALKNAKEGHAILIILEKFDGKYKTYIINSHPKSQYGKEILYSVKEAILENLNEKEDKFEFIINNCGTQLLNSHCVKYVFKIIYNYLKSGGKFEVHSKQLCPGYSEWGMFFKGKHWKTQAYSTKEKINELEFEHLSKEDVEELTKLGSLF